MYHLWLFSNQWKKALMRELENAPQINLDRYTMLKNLVKTSIFVSAIIHRF